MKKIIVITVAAVMAVLMCVFGAMAASTNYLIDETFPKLSDDESQWELMCWTVAENEIVRVGYILDNGEIVWIVNDIGHVAKQTDTVIKPNDCFRDDELEGAVIAYGMSGGLTECFAYRIHVTLDTSRLSTGKHQFELVAEYSDGTFDNPLTGEAGIKTFKIKKTVAPVTDPEETTEPEVTTEPEETTGPVNPFDETKGDINKDGSTDNKDVVALFRYVSGGGAQTDDPAYDMNNDNSVDNKDVVALFRYVSSK